MIQRLTDIKTDSSAAFDKESKLLLVRVDADCITLALTDKTTGEWTDAEILSIDDADWQRDDVVEDLKQKSRLAAFSGLQTDIYISATEALLVPVPLIKSAELFLDTHFGKSEEPSLIDELDAKMAVAFRVQALQKMVLLKLFPQAKWYSTLGLLISQLMAAESRTNATVAFLHISWKRAEVAFAQSGNLLIARCFNFSAAEDVLYHLLNTCRQLQLNFATLVLQIQGRLTGQDAVIQLLQRYISSVSFTELRDENDAISHAAFSQVPQHYLTPLMQEL